MEGVGFLWRRRQPVLEHGRDQVLDAARRVLRPEVELALPREGLAEDHHGVDVRPLHDLQNAHQLKSRKRLLHQHRTASYRGDQASQGRLRMSFDHPGTV